MDAVPSPGSSRSCRVEEGSHHGRACLSRPHRPLLARRSHLGGRRLTPGRGARGGGCCEEEGRGSKVGRNSDGDRNTKRERESAAETEKTESRKASEMEANPVLPAPKTLKQPPTLASRRIEKCAPIPQCFLLSREPYHKLLHNCILTYLNSSAKLFMLPLVQLQTIPLGKIASVCVCVCVCVCLGVSIKARGEQ